VKNNFMQNGQYKNQKFFLLLKQDNSYRELEKEGYSSKCIAFPPSPPKLGRPVKITIDIC
jgi:hypothetical protein